MAGKPFLTFTFIMSLVLIQSCKPGDENNKLSDSRVNEGMVYIPGGTFMMGAKNIEAEKDEYPRHEVTVSGFYMDETEVTNAMFDEFVRATGYITVAEKDLSREDFLSQVPGVTETEIPDSILRAGSLVFSPTEGPVNLENHYQWWHWTVGADWRHPEGPESDIHDKMNHPVVHVSHEDALAYAEWAGKRLPTEAEWEWAAMGGVKNALYPWGQESADKAFAKANYWQGVFPYKNTVRDGFEKTAPVGSFPPNRFGLYDMAGNVWEWCADKYHYKSYEMNAGKGSVTNPTGPPASIDPAEPFAIKYVMRGGSFLCHDSYCSGYRTSRRMKSTPDSGFNHTGFRCVVSGEDR